ncbi:MAG: hypothetical protein ACD_39C00425G0002 [uncultured bacterium]|nr:MAG: hypothetical protein ACD_39C00425G0002 [uncultured bacterium]
MTANIGNLDVGLFKGLFYGMKCAAMATTGAHLSRTRRHSDAERRHRHRLWRHFGPDRSKQAGNLVGGVFAHPGFNVGFAMNFDFDLMLEGKTLYFAFHDVVKFFEYQNFFMAAQKASYQLIRKRINHGEFQDVGLATRFGQAVKQRKKRQAESDYSLTRILVIDQLMEFFAVIHFGDLAQIGESAAFHRKNKAGQRHVWAVINVESRGVVGGQRLPGGKINFLLGMADMGGQPENNWNMELLRQPGSGFVVMINFLRVGRFEYRCIAEACQVAVVLLVLR